MSTYSCGVESIHSAAGYLRNHEKSQLLHEKQKKKALGVKREELRGIRISVVLTEQWEASDTLLDSRRVELCTELSHLRSEYLDKLDEIAMAFGVQTAIESKEEVERTVVIHTGTTHSMIPIEPEQLNS